MLEWLQGLAGPEFAAAVLWTLAALILLVVVLLVVKLVRNLTFGTFVAGGRNRKTRLAVMDATAVDSHRRLVLVRRDDVEHLILIGGPTDVVVERDIRLSQPRRPALTGDGGHEVLPASRARAPEPAPQRAPAPPPARVPERTVQQQPVARPPLREAAPAPRAPVPRPPAAGAPGGNSSYGANAPNHSAVSGSYSPRAVPAAPRQPVPPPPAQRYNSNLDDTLLKELEVSFDTKAPPKPVRELSLDEEMTKLLGELSSQKRP